MTELPPFTLFLAKILLFFFLEFIKLMNKVMTDAPRGQRRG